MKKLQQGDTEMTFNDKKIIENLLGIASISIKTNTGEENYPLAVIDRSLGKAYQTPPSPLKLKKWEEELGF